MANKGKILQHFLGFVVILIIHMDTVNLQGLPEISDMNFSYTDGQMNHLREKRNVNNQILEYIVIIEVNVSGIILLDQIKLSLESISPLQIDNAAEIDELNITTVCQPNDSKFQCTCEDQYVWSYNNCITYNACHNLNDGTCTCISAIPTDGQMCVPKNDTPTTYTTNTSTTVTSTTTTITTSTAFADIHVLNFSLAINEEFDFALTDQHSAKYQAYKTRIENSIDDSYRNIPTYQATSGKVTGFRPGSVIADFTIKTRSDNLNLVSVNQQLATNLRSEGFNVSETAFSQSVKDGLCENNGNIYPGTNLTLTCNAPFANDIIWTMNGNQLQTSNKYEINGTGLTVKHVTPNDNGQYACTTTVNSTPYVIWQTITIQPYPNIQVSSDKVVKCEDSVITLKCCVQGTYEVKWTDSVACKSTSTGCTLCEYKINNQECQSTDQVIQVTCQLTSPISGNTAPSYNSKSVKIEVRKRAFACSDSVFGAGNLGDVHFGDCNENMVGFQKAVCNTSGLWDTIEYNCIIRIIQNLKDDAKNLQVTGIQDFMGNVINSTTEEAKSIIESPATILTIVDILTIISNLSQTILIDQPVMRDFLKTTDIIGSVGARDKWTHLNKNSTTMNASSELLKSIESIASRLGDGNFNITTNYTSLSKINVSAPFTETFGINLTTQINLPMIKKPIFITVIISSALENALPVRNLTNNDSTQTDTKINGDVTMIKTTSPINNISLYFVIRNKTLGNPQCVFWNFSLLNGVGGWDTTGCQIKPLGTKPERFTCECNHTTSFSILMSPFTPDNLALDYITYTGVTISMVSLVLCLIIEIIIWKSVTRNDTSFMRHLTIVNIAVSLLIANICFISGAAVVEQEGYEGPCSTATFFMHFFYLALFFWMFLSALLLLYRTLMVFSRMTRGAMMAIGFTVGYGAPLIIAVITVASTAGGKGYIQQENSCWLNWDQTKALLAFVIPALTIVAINLLVLIVVLSKMLRRGVNASTQPDEKHPLVVIARCVAILTPLFGLTWGFGIGTLVSPNFGIHVMFAFFNSLQGFFILLFGILLDSKVRHTLTGKLGLKNLSSNHTRRMSAGPSSSSGRPFIQRV
ncbi:adhesion G protein-coupled receptor F5-like [Tachysurus vachellii]|uniref:adhesion G protein-coupled receptor F5-like n=1 Tax=Tachysurus vachellii TaxID=175792 RepID=UPI00296ACF58|nr:adhesion G protein-coupled receptor F5-like [Tachysurus vachellii]